MADPDDIDKLLREVAALNAPGGAVQPKPSAAAVPEKGGSGRGVWTGACAVGGLVVGGAAGSVLWFLPYISPGPTAVGAALGAAVAGLISGPPAWFRKG